MSKKSFVLDWFLIQKEIIAPIEQETKSELNTCLQKFYVSVRLTIGEPFKVSSLKAIRATIDIFLKQADPLTSRRRISLFSRSYFAGNSFPEFENKKYFEIKLSLSLTLILLLRFALASFLNQKRPLRCRCSALPTELSSQLGVGHIVHKTKRATK